MEGTKNLKKDVVLIHNNYFQILLKLIVRRFSSVSIITLI